MGRDVVRDIRSQSMSLGVETFSRIPRALERIIFILEFAEELVELVIMRAVYVVCELCEALMNGGDSRVLIAGPRATWFLLFVPRHKTCPAPMLGVIVPGSSDRD